MKAIRVLVLVCLLVMCAFGANAEKRAYVFYTGNTIFPYVDMHYDTIKRQPDAATRLAIYVAGVHSGTTTSCKALDHIPTTVTLRQLSEIYAKYLTDHPEKRHHPAAWLYQQAILEAFPPPSQ